MMSMTGPEQLREKPNMPAATLEAAKGMASIVSAVSTSRTPSEMIPKLKDSGCTGITLQPPGFLKEPEAINFKKDGMVYEIKVGYNEAIVTQISTGQTQVVPLKPVVSAQASKPETTIEFDDRAGEKTVENAIPSTGAPVSEQTASASRELSTKIGSKFLSSNPNLSKVKASIKKGIATVNVPLKDGVLVIKSDQEGATHIDSTGNETNLTTQKANALLKQNGYNINLEDFQKWLQKELQRMSSGSSGIMTPDKLQQENVASNYALAQTTDTTARAIDDAKRNVKEA